MKLARCIATIALLSSGLSQLAGAQTIRTVALTGDPAPGLSNGETFSRFDNPVIDAEGRVAFRADLSTDSSSFPATGGIWSESTGTLTKIAYRGDHATGTPNGVTYTSFEPPAISDTGEVAFAATLSGTGVVSNENDKGIWTGTLDSLTKVTRSGDQIPNAPIGQNFGSARFALAFQQSSSGELTFHRSMTGTGIDSSNFSAIWRYKDGVLSKLVQRGDQAPGLPSGVLFSEFYDRFTNNSDGNSTYIATLSGPGVDNSNSLGVWSETNGSLRLVAREVDQVPGMLSGVIYKQLETWGSSLGKTVFGATLEGVGITGSNNEGIWLENAGEIVPIVRDGDSVPGFPEGTTFSSPFIYGSHSAVNEVGQVSFYTHFTGGSGIWTGGTDRLSLIAKNGEHAPGTTGDINFNLRISNNFEPALNNAGNIAFYSMLEGEDITRDNSAGIWAQDPYGKLHLIIQQGNQIEVAPGDFRTVRQVGLITRGSNTDGTFVNRSTSEAFNDSNQLAFWAEFVEGSSGIFVSSFNAIPEPSTIFLATLTLTGALIKRRR